MENPGKEECTALEMGEKKTAERFKRSAVFRAPHLVFLCFV
jgi:hypothetical protein